jgi:endonuclease YncB( thermonuclease family)
MKKTLYLWSFLFLFLVSSCEVSISFPSMSEPSTPSSISSSESIYFQPVEMEYDGLRIDASYLNSSSFYTEQSGTKWGNGGTFSVDYDPSSGIGSCIDGDTTVFGFPSEVASLIESNPKRVRYLNIDTPETSGTPQRWGLLAKAYTCSRLFEAESILIQTDPGDKLLDPYGRLLGWVWIQDEGQSDYELLNYWLVRQGLAEVKYLFGAGETQATQYQNKTYTEWMYVAQNRAIDDELGMHSTLLDPYSD